MSEKITIDGNTATARIAYMLSEVAGIYPITPSSTMAELCSKWSFEKKKNLFGLPMTVREMQSEAGASGVVHGSLACGALATTFTSSQGLLLMIPNMYKIAGELLPCVFHVSARAIATHALSIFGDHSDVMAVRQTGFSMLCSSSVQECQDMALASHIASLKSSIPFVHFFDGFRTSHEIQKIDAISEEDVRKIYPYDKLDEFKHRALDPTHPHQQGTAQNPDIFFQNKEASNLKYMNVYSCILDTFKQIESITGRHYEPFEYYGASDAKNIIVIMGSGSDTAIETVKSLCTQGKKIGVIKVRLFRPFNSKAFVEKLPTTVQRIAVLDRTKEQTAPFEPLCEDVISSTLYERPNIKIVGGRYGIGGKEFTPSDVFSVFENLEKDKPINSFTVGINDDLTNLSLEKKEYVLPFDGKEYKFYGLGSDGTISANKNTIKIIGENTNLYAQGYFEYDSKKSGSLTVSHLRVSSKPIPRPYSIEKADLIAIHNYSFVSRYSITKDLKQNGIVILNTALECEELNKNLPNQFILDILRTNSKLYIIDAQKIAQEVGLGSKINTIMQTAFFKVSNVIDYAIAKEKMKDAIVKTYSGKGDEIIKINLNAIEIAEKSIKICEILDNFTDYKIINTEETDEYYQNFINPIESRQGDNLSVSAFNPSGSVPTNTSKFLKRGIASMLPCWNSKNCIQCGMCVMACPHSAIRSKLISNDDACKFDKDIPDAIGVQNSKFVLQISPLDCTGCGVCASVCPAKNKALNMASASEILEKEKENLKAFNSAQKLKSNFPTSTPKGLQFEDCYFEFNGACAGCGETPYIHLATTLFGKNMLIANATGCSSIYGGNAPVCPYSKDKNGCGPAWANSLFEDNAEFGLGFALAVKNNKEILKNNVLNLKKYIKNPKIVEIFDLWLSNDLNIDNDICKELIVLLEKEEKNNDILSILNYKDYFTKKSIWIIGGDGWAYDIGFGGLDHLLASNENVNILVLDSEVYSNTGGQASKSTPKGANAKFTPMGKNSQKKDLAQIAMSYKNAYVASISLGADMAQAIKAFKEAESYNGVSLIIAYSPCVNHGINMSDSNLEMKRAVQSGYWTLFRYNPAKQSPLSIDSPEPTIPYNEFLLGESRYRSILKTNPEQAKQLFAESEKEAIFRHNALLNLKDFYNTQGDNQ